MTDFDWVKKMADEIRAKGEQDAARVQAAKEVQDVIQANHDEYWQEVIARVAKGVAFFNLQFPGDPSKMLVAGVERRVHDRRVDGTQGNGPEVSISRHQGGVLVSATKTARAIDVRLRLGGKELLDFEIRPLPDGGKMLVVAGKTASEMGDYLVAAAIRSV